MEQTDPPAKVASNDQLGPNAQVWTCFHCGEVCADAEAARLHFGASEHQKPGCQIDLAEYRRMDEVNRRHCEEDTELHRALHRMESAHQQALRREEEAGYAKGLRDGRAESAALRASLRDLIDWMPRVVPAAGQEAEWESSLERACLAHGPLGPNVGGNRLAPTQEQR